MGNLDNMDIQVYNKLIENIEIKGIYLKKINTSDIEIPIGESINCRVELKYTCSDYKIVDKTIEFYPKFKLELKIDNIAPVIIQFDFRLIYEIENIEEYTDEYFDLFMDKNVPINVWPYAREIITSITTRIGYPPLVIAPYKG